MVTERLIQAEYGSDDEVIHEVVVPSSDQTSSLMSEMNDVVFKLRAFMESTEGDVGLGIEMGMQRAADMIQSVLDRHGEQIG